MRGIWILMLVLSLNGAWNASGLIFFSTGDPERNTTPPTGSLAGSGWEMQGSWASVTGTPIGPQHFIAAAHVGGVPGQTFIFQGTNYVTVAGTKDPSSDLKIWEVRETFPVFAALYDGESEVGAELVVFGRGALRGAEVSVSGALKGWSWGTRDQRLRWGRNRIISVTEAGGDLPFTMKAAFDASGSEDEAHLAVGDSSGGVFIEWNGVWKLAGINYAVDGPYNVTNAGAGFNAAVFDEGGLFQFIENSWILTPARPFPQPGSFYATRIRPRLAWIQSVLSAPTTPALFAANTVDGPYLLVSGAVIDAATRTIRVPIAGEMRFFELQSSIARTISSASADGATLVIRYE